MHPLLALRDRLTPLLMGKDTNRKLQEDYNHLHCLKRPNRRRRSADGLNIAALPQNPLRQVMHHPRFVGHDPFGVPAYVLSRRRSGNGLNIVVLPQNPLWQVMHHPGFVGHDRFGVPAYVLKRSQVSSALVRLPDYMSMLHLIHLESIVSSIRKSPGMFPSTHKRVLTIVIFIRLLRNELPDVSQNPSLQTQRDKFISAHKNYTNNYTFTIH